LSTYPNVTECLEILIGAGCTRRVLDHVCTVHTLALPIAIGCGADVDLVSAGAMLHDLGRAEEHGMSHAVVGVRLAEERGLDQRIVEIIRRHIGAGLDEQDVQEMGLPPGDYIPRSLEEKIVAHADNLVNDNRVWYYQNALEKMISKGLFRAADRLQILHNELSALYGMDLDLLVDALGEFPELASECQNINLKF